ncbi:UDP-N-acetylmuramoyl-tripeptide--D-alanyl-D-alanine ligase [uncultured Azohydromonas sp.]|uniref:UDP-N-acetylmuramoyl-tripeptide--D-alanyl-D- alanine ligase n=1 Tax=uncultured Azohydromonas sp. TaxID=487342 RepID=UPI00261BAD54|nr:UDP-N-acetylmuramoyl-tripeptide--D-alanyl-D-alanine ligase [uncultured Azohydromonas sp.]
MLTLREAQALLPGSTLVGAPDTALSRVHTDTRSLQPGDLFVALRGERFDGHDHLGAARGAGAVAAIAQRGLAEAGLPGLLVDDTLAALQTLAAGWRARFAALPLIAVTGSNGKTTVTQMAAAILRAWLADAALATAGNFNNHIGLPLTLLRLRPGHQAAVAELGMNHPGEIAELARIAQPTVALVNNAQREHQEFMASVEAVARENGSVIQALGADGCAVFPADDAFSGLWAELAGARRVLRFGPGGEVQGQAQWLSDHWSVALDTPLGSARLVLRMPGEHNVRNALAAAACALAAGAPLAAVVQGLEAFQPVAGRSQLKKLLRGGRELPLVDDSYNANPDSVRAAIEVLAALPAPRALLLGDMGEVGEQGPAFHREVGALAAQRGIETFWCAGTLCAHAAEAYGAGARHFATVDELAAALPQLGEAASVLVKGSRFMRMERVLPLLGEVR